MWILEKSHSCLSFCWCWVAWHDCLIYLVWWRWLCENSVGVQCLTLWTVRVYIALFHAVLDDSVVVNSCRRWAIVDLLPCLCLLRRRRCRHRTKQTPRLLRWCISSHLLCKMIDGFLCGSLVNLCLSRHSAAAELWSVRVSEKLVSAGITPA